MDYYTEKEMQEEKQEMLNEFDKLYCRGYLTKQKLKDLAIRRKNFSDRFDFLMKDLWSTEDTRMPWVVELKGLRKQIRYFAFSYRYLYESWNDHEMVELTDNVINSIIKLGQAVKFNSVDRDLLEYENSEDCKMIEEKLAKFYEDLKRKEK